MKKSPSHLDRVVSKLVKNVSLEGGGQAKRESNLGNKSKTSQTRDDAKENVSTEQNVARDQGGGDRRKWEEWSLEFTWATRPLRVSANSVIMIRVSKRGHVVGLSMSPYKWCKLTYGMDLEGLNAPENPPFLMMASANISPIRKPSLSLLCDQKRESFWSLYKQKAQKHEGLQDADEYIECRRGDNHM
jgi:hypothetical protein